MQKLILSLVLIATVGSSAFFAYAANNFVQVSATVGIVNHAPVVISTNPVSDPKLLGINKIQNYTLYFRDDEKDDVSYTITPISGYTNPINGIVTGTGYDSGSGAYITFTYLAPATVPSPNPTTVTVTLNDGSNLVSTDIHLYIY